VVRGISHPTPCPPAHRCARFPRVSAAPAAHPVLLSSAAMASASAPVAGAVAGNDDELADLVRRLVDALARYADRLPFDLDRQVRARICDTPAAC
jgi:hypothetical protein